MLKVGDRVKVLETKNIYEYQRKYIGTTGVIIASSTIDTCGVLMDIDGKGTGFYCSELELVKDKKYLVYNATSCKSVGIMSKESGIKCAASTPQCVFQLYELKYNIVPKPVQVEYEAVEVC